ncbi:MAG: membrane protein [Alphaproteobacteria bacterium]|nr:MAG: membrane protein [Alphaproteobacteria bacterium]
MDTRIMPRSEAMRRLGFTFTGSGREYFGIWIVNLLLSIVTVGIYTAWAKVRRLRYFYGNTWLDGHNFEYHAQPTRILIGRIIVVGALVAYNLLITLSPFFAALIIPYLLALPWLVNKSLAFNARMTSYRNVRFGFRGTYWGAFGVFVAMPFAALMTGGLLAPVASHFSNNYLGRHTSYGTARFATDAPIGALYGNFGATILFTIAAAALCGGAGFVIGGGIASFNTIGITGADRDLAAMLEAAPVFATVVGAYLALFLAYLFYAAGVRNIAFNATTLDGGHRLASSVGRLRYTWILVSNFFATIFTIGLLRPWAAVRTWRYLAASTAFDAAGPMDAFVDDAAPEGNVAAAEFFDIEGIDFGL